jgi:hypothetical protein
MTSTMIHTTLDRVFGFSAPAMGTDGQIRYVCTFCDEGAAGGPIPHAADCTYWSALPVFSAPAGRWLAERALRGGA